MLIVFDDIVDMATGSAFSILTGDVEHSIPAITVTGKAFSMSVILSKIKD